MGNAGARSFGLKEATTPVEESVAGVVKVVCFSVALGFPIDGY